MGSDYRRGTDWLPDVFIPLITNSEEIKTEIEKLRHIFKYMEYQTIQNQTSTLHVLCQAKTCRKQQGHIQC
jgi:hypothetical protein